MPQVRAVTLASYLNVARTVGLDGYALLAEHGIPADLLANPEWRFEAAKTGALMAQSAERSGCDSFGLKMAEARQFESIGPLVLLLQHLPTLRDVMTTLIEYRKSVSDVTHIALEEAGDTALLISSSIRARTWCRVTISSSAWALSHCAGSWARAGNRTRSG